MLEVRISMVNAKTSNLLEQAGRTIKSVSLIEDKFPQISDMGDLHAPHLF